MANIKEMKLIFEWTPPDQAIMLEAIHGIGKSEFVKEYWESKGYKVIILFCSQMADAGDLIGLPDRVINEHNTKVTTFCQPWWWPAEGEKVVIFLDELNRAKPEILQCVQDMILNRCLAGKKLLIETRIIAAINPSSDDSEYDVNEMEISLLDRFNKVSFFPDYDEWQTWAIKNKVHRHIIGFISKNAATFLDPPKKTKTGEVYPSRRSWKRLSDILVNNPSIIEDVDYKLKLIANTIVGIGASSKFSMYVKENNKGINVGLIVTDWKTELENKLALLPNQELININDELAGYLEQHQKDLFHTSESLSNKFANNVYSYLRIVPKEIIAHFFGLINVAASNQLSWQNDLLANSSGLVKYFMDVVNGNTEHDTIVEDIINGNDADKNEWE